MAAAEPLPLNDAEQSEAVQLGLARIETEELAVLDTLRRVLSANSLSMAAGLAALDTAAERRGKLARYRQHLNGLLPVAPSPATPAPVASDVRYAVGVEGGGLQFGPYRTLAEALEAEPIPSELGSVIWELTGSLNGDRVLYRASNGDGSPATPTLGGLRWLAAANP